MKTTHNSEGRMHWYGFTLIYLGIGFATLMASAIALAIAQVQGHPQGGWSFALIGAGIGLLVFGFISDEVAYRRGAYKMPSQVNQD